MVPTPLIDVTLRWEIVGLQKLEDYRVVHIARLPCLSIRCDALTIKDVCRWGVLGVTKWSRPGSVGFVLLPGRSIMAVDVFEGMSIQLKHECLVVTVFGVFSRIDAVFNEAVFPRPSFEAVADVLRGFFEDTLTRDWHGVECNSLRDKWAFLQYLRQVLYCTRKHFTTRITSRQLYWRALWYFVDIRWQAPCHSFDRCRDVLRHDLAIVVLHKDHSCSLLVFILMWHVETGKAGRTWILASIGRARQIYVELRQPFIIGREDMVSQFLHDWKASAAQLKVWKCSESMRLAQEADSLDGIVTLMLSKSF